MGYLSLSCSGVIPGSGYIGSPTNKDKGFFVLQLVVAKKDESMYLGKASIKKKHFLSGIARIT